MIEILQLSSYSSDAYTHGGKIRASEIAKCMEQLGFQVSKLDSKQLSYREQVVPEAVKRLPDVLIGDFCELYKNYDLWRHVNSRTRIVIFEQPWLWNEIKQIKAARPEIIVIFSSHNLEYKLKEKILDAYDKEAGSWVCRQVYELEKEIALNVDHIICVSKEEEQFFLELDSPSITVVPNGVTRWEKTQPEKEKSAPYALVIGSAHPPNISGCFYFLSEPNLWLVGDCEIKIVGSLSSALSYAWSGHKNVELIPYLNDAELHQLINLANVILLPIKYGGGTNLKTAEALISERPIVGSKVSFRGYEEYINEENVKITDDPMLFKQYVLSFMWNYSIDATRNATEKLEWDECFASFKKLMTKLQNA